MEYSCAASPDDLIRGRATVGDAELVVCTDGTALFDGGAMFGVVPKPLWQRRMPADEQNRVTLGLNCLVVRIGGKTVLIETGFGNKLSPKLQNLYGTQQRLPASLTAAGVDRASVDLVINTHLHWDHSGWNTVLHSATGAAGPFFPNARYIVHAGEVEHGRKRLSRDRVSYVADNYEPLLASRQMRMVHLPADGSQEQLLPGLRLECFPGHTAQLMVVHIESRGEHACFVSDLIPTSAHLPETWVMAFDLDPVRTIRERKRFFQRALTEDWLICYPHDHPQPLSRLQTEQNGAVTVA